MNRKLLTLLAALAVLVVAAGGVAAAEEIGETDEPDAADDGDEVEAGICVVGADSPCNGDDADSDGERIGENDSDDGQMWIPEDQNRDGEIDDRFRGNDSDDGEADVGVCMIGVESPCNGNTAEETASEQSGSDDGDENSRIGSGDDGEESQIWIPEDQNRDGQIDNRFLGDGPFTLSGLLFGLLGVF